MKKRFLFLCTALAGITATNAQVRYTDSSAIGFVSDSSRSLLYQAGQLSPIWMAVAMPVNVNRLQVGYALASGKYIAARDATRQATAGLHTEGKATLGTVHLWGSFAMDKTTEDSTRFAHQTRNNPTTPYYFGSPAYVSYRRTVYLAKARVLKAFFQQRLPLALALDYRVGNHFATNDPRGEMSDYQMNLSAAAGYRLLNNFTAAAEGYYGYGQENVGIGYTNRAAMESLADPRKITYIINGYSEPQATREQLTARDYRKRSGGGVSLLHTLGSSTLAFQGKWLSETQRYTYRADDGATAPLSEYYLNTTAFHLVWNRQMARSGITALLQYQQENGKDRHRIYLTHNYLYNARGYSGVVAYTVQQNRTTFNYGMRLLYNKLQYIDGAYSNNLCYRRVSLQPSFGLQLRPPGGLLWGVDVKGVYEKALQPEAVVAKVNESFFTREVIFHDYYYQTADVAGANASVHVSRNFDVFNAGIKINAGYQRVVAWNERVWPNAWHPGNDRFTLNAGVFFFF